MPGDVYIEKNCDRSKCEICLVNIDDVKVSCCWGSDLFGQTHVFNWCNNAKNEKKVGRQLFLSLGKQVMYFYGKGYS